MTDTRWTRSGGAITVGRIDDLVFRLLRIRKPASDTLAAVAATLGGPLASAANSVSEGAVRVLAIAPGEWLLIGDQLDPEAVERAAETAMASHVADLSHAMVTYEIAGDAASLLAKGCTLDFHERAFPVGTCAQSVLAQAFVTFDRISAESFRVYADISLSAHLQLWLEDALIEFGLGERV